MPALPQARLPSATWLGQPPTSQAERCLGTDMPPRQGPYNWPHRHYTFANTTPGSVNKINSLGGQRAASLSHRQKQSNQRLDILLLRVLSVRNAIHIVNHLARIDSALQATLAPIYGPLGETYSPPYF